MRNILIKLLKILMWALSVIMVAAIIIILASYAQPYIPEIKSYPYLNHLFQLEHNVVSTIREQLHRLIPTSIQGIDITRPLIIIVLLILISQNRALRQRLDYLEFSTLKYQEEFEKILKTTNLSEKNKNVVELNQKLEEMKQEVHGEKRKELILHFMEVQHKLESFKRVLAFLSIDVVGSTAMKEAEDPLAISADFYRYNELADKVLSDNKAIKVAKTPDGIMAAFSETDHAVNAAQQLINELDHFNKFVKKMKMDFKIRCGINAGMLYFDPEEPLENLSDRVIDIAGHMQKDAEPNSINIAKAAIAPLEKTGGFTSAEKVIDDQVVYTWKPK